MRVPPKPQAAAMPAASRAPARAIDPGGAAMIIGIPVYDRVDMLDVAGPYEMFDWAGFEVDLLAQKPGRLSFRTNPKLNTFTFNAAKTFADARRYDALWVPGGDPDALSALIYGADQTYINFLKTQAARSAWVCSVCEGAMLLAAAGLLDGYYATTHWAFIPCFKQRFQKVRVADGYPRFVLDRNRLTGGGISSGLDEALMLIQLLQGTVAAQGVQQTTQYYPDPPVTSELPPPSDECPIPLTPPSATT